MANRGRPVRPLCLTGQTDLVKVLKMQNGLHHYLDLVETIKMHMWNVRFGLRMREIWLQEVLHPGRPVRPVYRSGQTDLDSPDRVMSCILARN